MSPAVYAVIMLALGIILIGIEVAVIPGFGFIGLIGCGAMLYGGYITYVEYGAIWGVISLATSGVVAGVGAYLALKLGLFNRMVLQEQTTGEPSTLPGRADDLVGQFGTATSDLRPSGVARIDGQRIDVVATEGEYIESGTAVIVVAIDQNSIIVSRREN